MTSRAATAYLGVAAAGVAVLVLVVAAATTDEAVPVGVNRPLPDTDPIAGRCWPLPTAHLDFAYQVRSDNSRSRDVDGVRRRILILQYDRVDDDRVSADVENLLTSAGFVPSPDQSGRPTDPAELVGPDYGTVRFRVTPLPGTDADTLVRGVLELDLPAAAARDLVEPYGCSPLDRR